MITGMMVERDSGNRRVRKSWEDCLYILVIWEEACRLVEEREAMEDVRSCEEVKVSLVGLRVVAMEPFEAIAMSASADAQREGSGVVIRERDAVVGASLECQMNVVKEKEPVSLGPAEPSMIGPAFRRLATFFVTRRTRLNLPQSVKLCHPQPPKQRSRN